MPYYTMSVITVFMILKSNDSFIITSMSKCAPRALVFRRIMAISLTDCVKECSVRSGCAALNYYRKRGSCQLLNSDSSNTNDVPSCVYIRRQDIDIVDVCLCPPTLVCESIYVSGNRSCRVEECETLQLDNGAIHGNLNTKGSISRYRCEPLYQATTPTTVTCLETGQWSQIPSCIVDCGEPDAAINAVLFAGPTTIDSVRTYNCDVGYVSPYNQKSVSMYVTCLPSGVWSMVNIQCVTGNQVGYGCYLDTDCANTMSLCIENTCFCHVLYDYDSTLNDCRRVCESLTDDFRVIPNTYIVQYNGHRMYDISAEECKEFCRMNDTCYYFEDRLDGCIFGHVTVDMLYDADPGAIDHSENGYTVYSRICDPMITSGP